MCGRYCLQDGPDDVGTAFDAVVRFSWQPRFNITPTQRIPVVRRMLQLNGTPRRDVGGMHWGLIPSWAKDASIGSRMINARSETAPEKPSFRKAWVDRRCLVPASGFFEWAPGDGRKQPWFIRRKDRALMALAGLWECWKGPDGRDVESVTILTTTPNRFMSKLHDRMPVILADRDWGGWLDDGSDGTSLEAVAKLASPAPERMLDAIQVSRFVNNPANDEPRCIEEVA